MIVLDAYALVALLGSEPAAHRVEQLLRTEPTAVTVVNLAEAIDTTRRVHRLSEDEVRGLLAPLLHSSIRVLSQTEVEAWRAADLRARHYHRTDRAVSNADCFLLAAVRADDAIATADPAVAATARDEGIRVIALPDSSGERP